MAITIRTIEFASEDYRLSLELRNNVLRIPLGLSLFEEDLSGEKDHIHFAAYDNDNLIAILILLEGPPKAKMRQVAVKLDYQDRGIGRDLVSAAEDWLKEHGYLEVYCHARDIAMPFYLKLGYDIEGDAFTEVGIVHYKMRKVLA